MRYCDVLAEINGTQIAFEFLGSGPPCFVLHGGLGLDHQLYKRTLWPLANHLQLIFLDLRGNGTSGRPPASDFTIEAIAEDIAELATYLGHERFAVFGHSWGGVVAQEAMIRFSHRITAAIIVGSLSEKLRGSEPDDQGRLTDPPAGLLQLQLPHDDESAAEYWWNAYPYFTNAETVSQLREASLGTVYSNFALWHGEELYERWSSRDRLPHVRVPSLVVVGSNDRICPPEHSRSIAEQLSAGELVVLPNANHFPWIEVPDLFYRTVRSWLTERGVLGAAND